MVRKKPPAEHDGNQQGHNEDHGGIDEGILDHGQKFGHKLNVRDKGLLVMGPAGEGGPLPAVVFQADEAEHQRISQGEHQKHQAAQHPGGDKAPPGQAPALFHVQFHGVPPAPITT